MVTSKDFNLTKAHARWLESKLIALALDAQRTRILNGTNPPLIALPEADTSDMEYFTNQIKLVLPVLGENLLRLPLASPIPPLASTGEATETESPIFELYQANEDIRATAREVDGEFTVVSGSAARTTWIGTDTAYRQLHEQLIQNGTIVPGISGVLGRFVRNQVFTAPSAAAAVVLGRQANGRTQWKVQGTRETYGDWQQRGVAAANLESSPSIHALPKDTVWG